MSAAAAAMNEEVAVVPLISGYRFLPTDLELVRDYLCKKITNQKLPSDVPVVEYDIYSTEPWNLPVNNKIDTINNNRSYYFVKLLDGIDRRRHRQRIVNPSNSDDDHHNGVVGGTRRGGGGGGYWKKIAGDRDTKYIRDEIYRSIGVKKSFAFHAYLSSPPAPRHTTNNNNNNNINFISTCIFWESICSEISISDDEDDDEEVDEEEDDGGSIAKAMTNWKTNWIMDEYSLNSQRTQPWVLCILRKKSGGEEEDEVELLSNFKQVQQQQQQPIIINHDSPDLELAILKNIKTIQERIKTNQIKIWDDQHELRCLNGLRVLWRFLKQCKNRRARDERLEQIRDEFSKDKITIEEFQELEKQLWEEYGRKKAELEAEKAVIRATSYYQVQQLPSPFKKRRRN